MTASITNEDLESEIKRVLKEITGITAGNHRGENVNVICNISIQFVADSIIVRLK